MPKRPRIALVGDYNPAVTAHQAIPRSLELAAKFQGDSLSWEWVGTASINPETAAELTGFAAVWVVPASPYASMAGALAAIRLAREAGYPFLGTCGGFQHALLEYARHVLGLEQAEHAETAPGGELQLIAPLSCELVERTGVVNILAGSRLLAIYGASTAEEPYHCRYGLNPRHAGLFDQGALRIAARDETGEARAVELVGHPFFIAMLFQPERAALAGRLHPVVAAFAAAAAGAVVPAFHA